MTVKPWSIRLRTALSVSLLLVVASCTSDDEPNVDAPSTIVVPASVAPHSETTETEASIAPLALVCGGTALITEEEQTSVEPGEAMADLLTERLLRREDLCADLAVAAESSGYLMLASVAERAAVAARDLAFCLNDDSSKCDVDAVDLDQELSNVLDELRKTNE